MVIEGLLCSTQITQMDPCHLLNVWPRDQQQHRHALENSQDRASRVSPPVLPRCLADLRAYGHWRGTGLLPCSLYMYIPIYDRCEKETPK